MELIEREARIKAIENDCPEQTYYTKKDAIECVLCMPTIDPIRAAGGCRCGECKFGGKSVLHEGFVYCKLTCRYKNSDGYCDEGKPREARHDG